MSSKVGALLTTATVAVVVIVAFALLYPPSTPQGNATAASSTASSTSATSSISVTFITTGSSSTMTSGSTSSSSTTSSQTSTTQTSSTQTSTTRTTSSKTFNSTNQITIPYGIGGNESLTFQPSTMTVVIGVNNTIVWSDLDADQHTVTSMSVPSGAAKFDSGILNQGQTFRVTLTVPGTYRYYCTIHPTWMRGIIVVKA